MSKTIDQIINNCLNDNDKISHLILFINITYKKDYNKMNYLYKNADLICSHYYRNNSRIFINEIYNIIRFYFIIFYYYNFEKSFFIDKSLYISKFKYLTQSYILLYHSYLDWSFILQYQNLNAYEIKAYRNIMYPTCLIRSCEQDFYNTSRFPCKITFYIYRYQSLETLLNCIDIINWDEFFIYNLKYGKYELDYYINNSPENFLNKFKLISKYAKLPKQFIIENIYNIYWDIFSEYNRLDTNIILDDILSDNACIYIVTKYKLAKYLYNSSPKLYSFLLYHIKIQYNMLPFKYFIKLYKKCTNKQHWEKYIDKLIFYNENFEFVTKKYLSEFILSNLDIDFIYNAFIKHKKSNI